MFWQPSVRLYRKFTDQGREYFGYAYANVLVSMKCTKKIIYPTGLQKNFINDFTFTSLNLAKGGGENLPKLCYVAHSLTVKVAFPTTLGPLPPFLSASLQPEKLI